MYFKRIDIQGFKSFAEPVSIEFHEGITCIVGPNGSGKSNISDAIRWVLGEQSPKMLRGGKMEEIIFSGTANRKSRGMAEVTLVIDNTANILPIDYSEVAITRRMYRSGESEYYINKVPCRLRDIRELIMDTGIGVDGYSIIGQGKIADIVSIKPDSRREIFEEAAGIVKYRSKKQESERKLESSRLNLDRVNDIIGELESRIGGLEEDSGKAKEYLKLRDRLKDIEINIIIKNIENLELKDEYIKDDIKELSNQIEIYKEEKEAIGKDMAENKDRNDELERLGNEIRDKLMLRLEEFNTLTNQSQLRKEKLSAMDKEEQRLAQELTVLHQKKKTEESNKLELENNFKEIDKELAACQAQLEEKNKELNALAAERDKISGTIDSNKDIVYELHSLISGKKSEINSLKSLKDSLLKRREELDTYMKQTGSEGDSLSNDYEDAIKKRDYLRDELEKVKEKSLELNNRLVEEQSREKQLGEKLSSLNVAIGQQEARRKMIEEMESTYEGYHQGVKHIMKSGLNGLFGVVAELIRVPAGLETAIETALGPALQNIVCRDEKVAQEAIRILKADKAGRLTFLPVSRISFRASSSQNRLLEGEGFRGFASDCIEYDSKFDGIMQYLLGRVAIVDTLNNAVKLSKKVGAGIRFVTLDGEIINASGAITGGSYKTRTAGLLERKAEAAKLDQQLAQLNKRKIDIIQEVKNLTKILREDRENLESLYKKQKDMEMQLLSITANIEGLKSKLFDIENRQNRRHRELQSIEQEEASASKMISDLQSQVTESENRIAKAEAVVEQAMASYELNKSKLDTCNEEITEIRLKLGAAESEKQNINIIMGRVEGYIIDYTAQIDSRNEALKNLRLEKQTLVQSGEGVAERLGEIEKEKAEAEEKLIQIQEEKRLTARYLDELQQKKEAIEEELLDVQGSKHELELKLAKNETQVDSYKEKLWEEFEVSYIQAIEFRKDEFVMSAAQRESRELKNRIKELGEVNVGAIKEYEIVKERYEFLLNQRNDLISAMDSLVQIIDDMDKTIKRSFSETFNQIALNFQNAFQSLFGGGTAELRLEDPSNPLEAGIEIVAQPPGKKLQNINLMSGGEKTMTAIALMFAILKTKPTPFCILDEVEAALDDINIERFAKYLKDFREIQFALVTHQKTTMEYADVLYGVTMPEQGISKVISLKLGDEFSL